MNDEILDKIKSRGYWYALARPTRFVAERIPSLTDCQELIAAHQIKLGGWYFPHLNPNELVKGVDYIGTSVAFSGMNETWRFYQSGQFVFFKSLYEDWLSENMIVPESYKSSIKPETGLDILDALRQLSEIYEFVARLAQRGLFDDSLYLKVNLVNRTERRLFFWPGSGRYLSVPYSSQAPELPRERTFNTTDFVAHSREYSYEHFVWIMERFGFTPSEGVFKRDQEKFFEGRM